MRFSKFGLVQAQHSVSKHLVSRATFITNATQFKEKTLNFEIQNNKNFEQKFWTLR